MLRREPRTWLELLVARGGYRQALRVSSFIACWAVVESELERRPTVDEFADWWGADTRTAYRDLERFRELLPWFDHPTGFLALAGRDLASAKVPAQYLEAT